MKIVLNGEDREVPEGLSVASLLVHLGITSGRVAIERNLDILPRDKWDATRVKPDDRYEVVHFVGGG